MNKLTRPWSVQVELVEGCTRICPFCGLNGIREKPGNFKYMDIGLAADLATQCGNFCPNSRYEFAMHGEPLMHPRYPEIFEIFRQFLPDTQIQVTTNGNTLGKNQQWMQSKVEAIFNVGIDFIILDTYWPERDKLRELAYGLTGIEVVDFYDQMAPNGISPWYNHRRGLNNTVILMDDLLKRNGEVKSRTIYNHAGNSAMKGRIDPPLKKTCTMPFREISIRWDGSVSLCCHDWGDEYHIGNVKDMTIEEIWNSERFEVARKFLQNKLRVFNPCSGCDIDSGSRSGLLPKYDVPISEDAELVLNIVKSSPRHNGFPLKLTEDFDAILNGD